MTACRRCGAETLTRYGIVTCGECGREEVDPASPEGPQYTGAAPARRRRTFLPVGPMRQRRAAALPPPARRRRRRRASPAGTFALFLLAAALAVGTYLYLSEPDRGGFLPFSSASTFSSDASAPTDYTAPVAVDGLYHRAFEWQYKGRTYNWQMDLTEASYEHFRNLERPERRYQEGNVWHVRPAYDIYVSNPDDDPFINALGTALLDQARKEGFSDDEALSFTLSFIQSLPYTRDDVTTGFDEYPRFPVETLVDGGGDCEDTSILYASLVLAMGYGAVMVSPPGHMAVGVAASKDVPGTSYDHGGQRYLYAETTGDGYGIGKVPDQYFGTTVVVYDLRPKPLFNLEVVFGEVTRDGHQVLHMKAVQTGSATAHEVSMRATVGRSGGTAYHEVHCDAGQVQPGTRIECTLLLDLNKVPRGTRVVVRAYVQDSQFLYDETSSMPWVPRA